MTERNIYSNRRSTDRARAITAMKKREAAKKRKIAITSIAATLVIALIAGIAVLGTTLISNQANATAPTTVSKLSITSPTAQQTVATQAASPAPAQTAAAPTPAENNNHTDNSAVNNHSANAQQAQPAEASSAKDKGYSGGVSADGIIYDQRHEVPQNAGAPLHYYATGKTSGGYDWDYSADSSNISVCCNYNTATNQYDFIIYGKAQGIVHLTLYYYTADNVKTPVSLTLNIDKDLNVTQV